MYILPIVAGVAQSLAPCEPPTSLSTAEVARIVGRQPRPGDLVLTGIAPSEENPQATAYVRNGERWNAHTLHDSQEVLADYRTPQGLRIIFGFHTSEGPGEQFSGLVLDRNGRALSCPTLEFPKEINLDERTGERDYRMEMLKFRSLKVDSRGRGRVIGDATVDDRGREVSLRFEYLSTDGGRSWGPPRKIGRPTGASKP
jgi:hypothetical protein